MAIAETKYYSVCPDCGKKQEAEEGGDDSKLCRACIVNRHRDEKEEKARWGYAFIIGAEVIAGNVDFVDLKELGSMTIQTKDGEKYQVTGGYSGDLCLTKVS